MNFGLAFSALYENYMSLRVFHVLQFFVFYSDQKDPFNRSPLTLSMVQKHAELKERIQQWLAEVKAQKKS